jgi:hypothetical protein
MPILADATKVYADLPHVSVRWEGHNRWVAIEWKGWAKSAEFSEAMEISLRAVEENAATRYLADLRNAKLVVVDDERWLKENLLPRMTLAGIRFMAMVTPVNPLTQAIVSEVTKSTRSELAPTEQFDNLQAAEAWLRRTPRE